MPTDSVDQEFGQGMTGTWWKLKPSDPLTHWVVDAGRVLYVSVALHGVSPQKVIWASSQHGGWLPTSWLPTS